MTIRIAINGVGRIGRNVMRAVHELRRWDVEIVAINDLAPLETIAHLVEFDSVHGRFKGPVTVDRGMLDLGAGPMRVSAERNPEELKWQDVDLAMVNPVRSKTK